MQLLSYLRAQAERSRSTRLAQLAVLVSDEDPQNPFTKVLREIHNMKLVIDKEKTSDEKKRDTCVRDRKENNDMITEQEGSITASNTKISESKETLGSIEENTGLVNDLGGEQGSKALLQISVVEQNATTQERTENNKNYQQSIADLQVAQNLIKNAMKVLKTYYDKEKVALVQQEQEDSSIGLAEPAYDVDKNFTGQSASGGILELMQTMLDDTAKEEAQAHQDEQTAQALYEDSMKLATGEESHLGELILSQKKQIAEANIALDEGQVALAEAEKLKASAEKYLAEIKKGCDFIIKNFDARATNRVGELKALDNAVDLIKDTPFYKKFEKEAALGSTR